MSANFYAVFSEKGMELLREGKVSLKKGGLRWPDGTLFELASLVPAKAKDDLADSPGIQKALKQITAQCAGIQKSLRDGFQEVYRKTNHITQLTRLNTAVSIGNAALSVIETAVICQKLDGLKEDIQEIDGHMQTVYKAMLLSQTEYPFHHYVTRVKNDLIGFKKKDYYERFSRDINNLLGDIKEYLCKILNWFENDEMTAEKGESACNIVFTLLPLYSRELVEVCRSYVKQNGTLPPQYEEWSAPFSALGEEPFQSALKRFLVFGHPELSPKQKAAVRDTMNWTITNMLKEQLNYVKLCNAVAAQQVSDVDEVNLQPVSLDDLKSMSGMSSV